MPAQPPVILKVSGRSSPSTICETEEQPTTEQNEVKQTKNELDISKDASSHAAAHISHSQVLLESLESLPQDKTKFDKETTKEEEKLIVLSNYSDYLQFKDETRENPDFINLFTVTAKEMPAWYVDNEFIYRGYRRITNSYYGCIKSLAYVHNETGNIYSHGLGAIAFFIVAIIFYTLLVSHLDAWSDYVIMGTFFFGALVCLGLSTTFHLCCCHSRKVSLLWNKADYLGIVFLIIGSFVPVIYYGNVVLKAVYLTMISVFGLGTICISISSRFSTPQYRFLRTALFTGMGLSGVLPLVHSMFLYGFRLSRYAFASDRLIIMGVLYVMGALVYASRVPERWFPGKFDLFGHSHQIFHILVLAGASIHFSGIMEIYYWWHDNNLSCSSSTQQLIDMWGNK